MPPAETDVRMSIGPSEKPEQEIPPLKGGRGDVQMLPQVAAAREENIPPTPLQRGTLQEYVLQRGYLPKPLQRGHLSHVLSCLAGTAEPSEFRPAEPVA